jgi:hypothetical protein
MSPIGFFTKVAQVWLEDGDFLSFGMYFWMVRFHTLIPSLSSSPRNRSAPHNRCSFALLRMRSIFSGGIFGVFCFRFDFIFGVKMYPFSIAAYYDKFDLQYQI